MGFLGLQQGLQGRVWASSPLSSSFSYPQQPVIVEVANSPFRSWLAGWGREAGLRGGGLDDEVLNGVLALRAASVDSAGVGGGQGPARAYPAQQATSTSASHLPSPSSHLEGRGYKGNLRREQGML